jgi:molecular chaperone DnaK
MSDNYGPVIGIDLGTTNSCVAYVKAGNPEVIINAEGGRTTPSVLSVKEDGSMSVGIQAKKSQSVKPLDAISSIKRKMGQKIKVNANNTEFSPEEVSAKILAKLKNDAEAVIGREVTHAVITVPAYFNDAQRTSTRKAGELAGLTVLRIVNEPTAAALAYGINENKEETVLVYDLGGGTFDVSILHIIDGLFEVMSTNGDTQLGGDDLDEEMYKMIVEKIPEEYHKKINLDSTAQARIRQEAEQAKHALTSSNVAEISIPYLLPSEGYSLSCLINRAAFEQRIESIIDRTKNAIDIAMSDADITPADIDEIILVGGSTRVPLVVDKIKKWLDKEPCKGVNPDEVVAIGAAIQGSILTGDTQGVLLLDVTPLTLGVETEGGVCDAIIERNSKVPVTITKTYTTAYDNQEEVVVKVYQGERKLARYNKLLGDFHLEVMPAPARQPEIDVSFDIDVDGIITVSALDNATKLANKITIKQEDRISNEEVEAMMKDAEAHAKDDEALIQKIEARQAAEQRINWAENIVLKKFGDKIPENLKSEIELSLEGVKKNLAVDNYDVLRQSVEELESWVKAAGAAIYQQAKEQHPDQ